MTVLGRNKDMAKKKRIQSPFRGINTDIILGSNSNYIQIYSGIQPCMLLYRKSIGGYSYLINPLLGGGLKNHLLSKDLTKFIGSLNIILIPSTVCFKICIHHSLSVQARGWQQILEKDLW